MLKLPFWRAIKFGFWSTVSPSQIPEIIRLCAPWILGYLLIDISSIFLLPTSETEAQVGADNGNLTLIILLSLKGMLIFLSFVPVAKWHRFILMKEKTSSYRIGKSEIQYALTLFALGLLICIPMIGFSLVISMGFLLKSDSALLNGILIAIGTLLWICGFISFTYGGARLSLALPEAAIGDKFQFRRSWRAAKGNVARLFFAPLIVGLTIAVPMLAILGGIGLTMIIHSPILMAMVNFIIILLSFVGSLAATSVLSMAYAHLIEPRLLPSDR